jgi:hypothetical protein
MIGKTISHDELTPACGGICNLNPLLEREGLAPPLLLVSRRSRQRRGEGVRG